MSIKEISESREPCTAAGWEAWDVFLNGSIDETVIKKMRRFGSLCYLKGLKKPFFKTETAESVIRGFLGDEWFRVSATEERGHEILEELRNVLQ